MKMLYGVFLPSLRPNPQPRDVRFGLTRNKRIAIAAVRAAKSGEVRQFPDIPEYTSFDAPTFRVLSDRIFSLKPGV